MSNDAKKEVLKSLLLFSSMVGMGDVNEYLWEEQDEPYDGQSATQKSYSLPNKMYPNKEAFEKVGFTFTKTDDDLLCHATLPDGWSINSFRADPPYFGFGCFIDARGRYRGSYSYSSGDTSLCTRYDIISESIDSKNIDGPIKIFVKDRYGNILYTAGQCEGVNSEEYKNLMADAEKYLQKNFPNWEDVTAYWDCDTK